MRLLDTDVCVEILRGNQTVLQHRQSTADEVRTTWVTASELFYGAAKSGAPEHNRLVVVDLLATMPVLGANLAAANQFGRLKASLERTGQRLADADLFIAAIALTRGAVLVTGNLRHYCRIEGLLLEDWVADSRAPAPR